MKKQLVSLGLAALMTVSLAVPAFAAEEEEGKVFNIYAWNEEFKGFFEKYYEVPEGITVNWIITPSDNGAYQQDAEQIGRLSVRKLVEKIEHSRTCVDEEIPVTGKLLEGSSVARIGE